MQNTTTICLAGFLGIAFGVSLRLQFRDLTAGSAAGTHSKATTTVSVLTKASENRQEVSGSSSRLELEAIFAQSICDRETTERVVSLLREWGKDDIIELFRWWRNRDFRFLEATIPDTYAFLLRKLAETDQAFAWQVAESLKHDPTRFGDLAREIARVTGTNGDADDFRQFLEKIDATAGWESLEPFGYPKIGFYGLFAHANPDEAIRFVQGIKDPAERMAAVRNMDALTLDAIIANLPDGSAKDAALLNLAYDAKNDGDWEMAIRALGEIKDSSARRKTAEVMARQLLDRSELEGFETLYQSFELDGNPTIEASAEAIHLLKSDDLEGISRLLDQAPSSAIASTIKKTVSRSIARQDLEGALSWLERSGSVGLEDDDALIRSAMGAALTGSDPVSVIQRVAQGFPEFLPLTDRLIDMVHDVQAAESVFDLMPAVDQERMVRRWLERYETGLTSEQVGRIKSRYGVER